MISFDVRGVLSLAMAIVLGLVGGWFTHGACTPAAIPCPHVDDSEVVRIREETERELARADDVEDDLLRSWQREQDEAHRDLLQDSAALGRAVDRAARECDE